MGRFEEDDTRRFAPTARHGKEQLPLILNVTVTNTNSNDRPYRFICLRVEDERSGYEFLSVELPFEAWGELISGHTDVPAVGNVRFNDRIGKFCEVKMETFVFPRDVEWRTRRYGGEGDTPLQPFLDAAAPFEIDGWKASHDVNSQTHTVKLGEGYGEAFTATFRRYLDTDPKAKTE